MRRTHRNLIISAATTAAAAAAITAAGAAPAVADTGHAGAGARVPVVFTINPDGAGTCSVVGYAATTATSTFRVVETATGRHPLVETIAPTTEKGRLFFDPLPGVPVGSTVAMGAVDFVDRVMAGGMVRAITC